MHDVCSPGFTNRHHNNEMSTTSTKPNTSQSVTNKMRYAQSTISHTERWGMSSTEPDMPVANAQALYADHAETTTC